MRLLNGPDGTLYAVREDAPLRFLTISPVPRPGLVGMMPDVATYAEQLRGIADRLEEELAAEAKVLGDAGRGPTPANIDAPHVEGAKTTAGAGIDGFIHPTPVFRTRDDG